MIIREVKKDDEKKLQLLQSQCTSGDSIMLTTVNQPDFFARSSIYKQHKIFVAEENGEILGSLAGAIRNVLFDKKNVKVGYVFQMFVSTNHRRCGAGRMLYEALDKYFIENDVDIAYFIVMVDNFGCKKLYEKQGYSFYCQQTMPYLPVFKKRSIKVKGIVRKATIQDAERIAQLHNKTWQGYNLQEMLSKEAFIKEVDSIPAYDFENLIVYERDGKVCACVGYWDWSKVTKITVQDIDSKLKIIKNILNVVDKTVNMPHIPNVGSELLQWCLIHMCFEQVEDIVPVLQYINNLALDKKIEMLCFTCNKSDAVYAAVRQMFHLDIAYDVFWKKFKNEEYSEKPLLIRGVEL